MEFFPAVRALNPLKIHPLDLILSGGMATFGTSTLPSGSNSITASYGSTNYTGSSSAAIVQVVQ